MIFAENACRALGVATDGAFLNNGISRVDMFCDNKGDLVVNEFENLDANFPSTGINEAIVMDYLENYYVEVLQNCLQNIIDLL